MNFSIPYFWLYQINHKATDPFKIKVRDIEIIRNFFPTPFSSEICLPLEFILFIF